MVLYPRWNGSPEGCDSISKGSNFCGISKPCRGFFSPGPGDSDAGDVGVSVARRSRQIGPASGYGGLEVSNRSGLLSAFDAIFLVELVDEFGIGHQRAIPT